MKKTRTPFTGEQIEFIRQHYATMSAGDIASILNRTKSSIYNFAFKNGLHKSIEFVRETARINSSRPDHGGNRTKFIKGHIPLNKGKTWMETFGKPHQLLGTFKKGHLPTDTRKVGDERIIRGYIYVKIAMPNKWKSKHRLMWERQNGTIPPGMNLQFRDGNPLNCELSNLYLISRSDQMKNENSIQCRYPPEIRQAIQASAALTRQINRMKDEQ